MESDDPMPPLEYVGSASATLKAAAKNKAMAKQDAASDDSMPPLECVGSSGPASSSTHIPKKSGAESDDGMPRLLHVGTSVRATSKPHSVDERMAAPKVENGTDLRVGDSTERRHTSNVFARFNFAIVD